MPALRQVFTAIEAAWRSVTGRGVLAHEAILRSFVDNFDGLVLFTADGRVLTASRAAARLRLGDAGIDLVGRQAAEILPQSVLEAAQKVLADGPKAAPTPM